EISKRMTQRRKFPIEHGQDARLCGMKDHVVAAEVTMHDRGYITGRDMRRQPLDQSIHVRIPPRLRVLHVLPRPARDLPLEIVARSPEVRKTDGGKVDAVKLGER